VKNKLPTGPQVGHEPVVIPGHGPGIGPACVELMGAVNATTTAKCLNISFSSLNVCCWASDCSQALPIRATMRMHAFAAQQQREGYCLEGGRGDRDPDHDSFRLPLRATTLVASASPDRNAAHASITGRRLSSIELRW
jgi:hypothetical protein